jgi:hypothetical protein
VVTAAIIASSARVADALVMSADLAISSISSVLFTRCPILASLHAALGDPRGGRLSAARIKQAALNCVKDEKKAPSNGAFSSPLEAA